MPVLPTRVDPRSEAYRVNHAAMLEQVRALEEQLALARAGGGEKYVRGHRERKKLLPRERIELLLGRDAPFLVKGLHWGKRLVPRHLRPCPGREGPMPAVDSKASRSAAATAVAPAAKPRSLATLALGALGVVYGDIGTSPLYALRQCLTDDASGPANPQAVLGLLSLVFWSLTVIICVKYLTVMMRADNRGEGGILALLALVVPHGGAATDSGRRRALVLLGLFGAALLYGDGVITPAISVLSAVEGLQPATNALHAYGVPVTIALRLVLFAVQRRGTARVGATFGPVMVVWFLVIGGLGLASIVTPSPRPPSVLHAIEPTYAASYLARGGGARFPVLGAVGLGITGPE